MSHFLVGVIVPKDTENIEGTIEDLLKPYDENQEVEEYERPCHCVGQVARRDAVQAAIKECGTIEELRKRFDKEVRQPLVEKIKAERNLTTGEVFNLLSPWSEEDEAVELDGKWKECIASFQKIEKETFENHPEKDNPDPTCGFYSGERQEWWEEDAKEGDRYKDGEGCGGTGVYMSTYNPKSQWDWWRIGGRWNGAIKGTPENDDHGFNFPPEFEKPENNTTDVNDLLAFEKAIDNIENEKERKTALKESRLPYALVTPEGEWIEKGEMGWWGMSSNEKDNWREIALGVFEKYADYLVVGVDCHI
jgi:hypothetical protein